MHKVIQTHYDNHYFRSRIEARWAVFFNTLGIDYEYEKEGFQLDNLCYLPDFYIPHLKCWIEIKGYAPTEEETEKAHRLCIYTKQPVYIFYPDIPDVFGYSRTNSAEAFRLMGEDVDGPYWDNNHAWCECPQCGFLGIEFEGTADRLPCGHNIDAYPRNSRRIINAYKIAKEARF